MTEEADISIESILQIIYDKHLYRGPGAYTVSELVDAGGYSEYTARKKAKKAVESGELVAVWVQPIANDGRRGITSAAYVRRDVYDKWMSDNGSGTG